MSWPISKSTFSYYLVERDAEVRPKDATRDGAKRLKVSNARLSPCRMPGLEYNQKVKLMLYYFCAF
jgi:hypothetical protein